MQNSKICDEQTNCVSVCVCTASLVGGLAQHTVISPMCQNLHGDFMGH